MSMVCFSTISGGGIATKRAHDRQIVGEFATDTWMLDRRGAQQRINADTGGDDSADTGGLSQPRVDSLLGFGKDCDTSSL